MAGDKSKKRALSYDSDEDEASNTTAQPGKTKPGGSDWAAWQEGVRSKEADRVQQYVKTFQNDIVQKAHAGALADLRRRESTRAQHEKKMHDRILGECAREEDAVQQHPLYVAGCQVLDLLDSTLEQFHQTAAALHALHGASSKADFERMRSSWDNDLNEAHKLLGYGRAYGDGLVRDIIVPAADDRSTDKIPGAASLSGESDLNQTGKAALGMFPRSSTAVASRDTWGEAAQSQMEVLSRLMQSMSGAHAEGSYSVLGPEKKTVRFDL